MKLCRKCNVYYDGQELVFCSKCGNKLEDVNICLKCHTVNDLDATFCKKCGTNLNESVALESVSDQASPSLHMSEDNTSEEPTHTNWTLIIGGIIVIFGIILAFNKNSIFPSNQDKFNDERPKATAEEISRINAELSKNYQPIVVANATIFVPTKGLLIKDKSKYSPSTAFVGQINRNNDSLKDSSYDNSYEIRVIFGGNREELRSINYNQEKEYLNKLYESFWEGSKERVVLLSKDFCHNMYGDRYLKFSYSENNNLRCKVAIFIYYDTAYIIYIRSSKAIMDKCESEIEMIFNSFTDREVPEQATKQTKPNTNNTAKVTTGIPKDFQSIREENWELYVPKEGFERFKLPKQSTDGGIVLAGIVKKKKDSNASMFNMYDICLIGGKDPSLKSMKPEEEEEVLNNMFISTWESAKRTAKVATKNELKSKEICTNIFGHKYLKASYVFGDPHKPQNDCLCIEAIYIYGDMGYMVKVSTLEESAEKYKSEMEQILNYFNAK